MQCVSLHVCVTARVCVVHWAFSWEAIPTTRNANFARTNSERLKNFMRHFMVAVIMALLPARPWERRERGRVVSKEKEKCS